MFPMSARTGVGVPPFEVALRKLAPVRYWYVLRRPLMLTDCLVRPDVHVKPRHAHVCDSLCRSYAENQHTDQTEAELINEVIREKLFNNLHKEVPYQIVQSFRILETDKTTNALRIDQDIIVPTRSHVKMLLGKSRTLFHQRREGAGERT